MTPLARAGRLWRTVRWLKARQILGRVRFRLARPRPDLAPPPPRRASSGPWQRPPAREPSLVARTRMRFLAVEHDLEDVGWDDPRLPLLWRYNQHYFDDLNAAGAGERRGWHEALVIRWLAENPPGRGTAWAPYPTSLRIVNWIKWCLAQELRRDTGAPGAVAVPCDVTAPMLASLAVQARWLMRRLEWHLLGNHLFVNAKALVFAGVFFDGPEAAAWLDQGLAILERELPEQILADGGQFERSPMYHALALEDVLDLVNLAAACAPATPSPHWAAFAAVLRAWGRPMLHWLRCLQHPGGALGRFNDSADGIAPATVEIERYAAALGIGAAVPPAEGLRLLRSSGYVRAAHCGAVALLDVAPVGPDYLPGHAHADTLSFELSIGCDELIVNRGTSVYGDGPRRQLERGTAAHSTVQLGDHESSEVWAGFRVGRRARVHGLDIAVDRVGAEHDGNSHLPGAPRHRRQWCFEREAGAAALRVIDELRPVPRAPAPRGVARHHLAPGLRCAPAGDPSRWDVWRGERRLASAEIVAGRATVESWQHARRFGELVDASTLVVQLDDRGRAEVRWIWPPPGP